MSGIDAWKSVYYRRDADSLIKSKATDLQMVRHAIRKWRGLTPEALKKHRLEANGRHLLDVLGYVVFSAGSASCALCTRHADSDATRTECMGCPLYVVRGGVRCCDCDARVDVSGVSPWGAFAGCASGKNPRPMLRWLRAAEAMLVERQRRNKLRRERRAHAKVCS